MIRLKMPKERSTVETVNIFLLIKTETQNSETFIIELRF